VIANIDLKRFTKLWFFVGTTLTAVFAIVTMSNWAAYLRLTNGAESAEAQVTRVDHRTIALPSTVFRSGEAVTPAAAGTAPSSKINGSPSSTILPTQVCPASAIRRRRF